MAFIRTSLGESSVAFMALENRDLSARIGIGLGDWNVSLRICWDMHSSVTRHGRHGRPLKVRPAATQCMDETIKMSLQHVPWWRQSKAVKEFLGWDSGEMNWCMRNRTKVLIDHANDGTATMVCDAHFKNTIQYSR